jgi:hypothetical protein
MKYLTHDFQNLKEQWNDEWNIEEIYFGKDVSSKCKIECSKQSKDAENYIRVFL